jgi:hypothetical protein
MAQERTSAINAAGLGNQSRVVRARLARNSPIFASVVFLPCGFARFDDIIAMINKLTEWFDMAPEAVQCALFVAFWFAVSCAVTFGLIYLGNVLGIK